MLFLAMIFSSGFVFSQDLQKIEGKVLERGTKKILKDVNVFLLPKKAKAVTDETGMFKFSEEIQGECQLIINLTGYKRFEKRDDCSRLTYSDIYLEKKSYTSFETTVTSKVTKRDDQAQSLTQEEFLKAPGSFGGDPVRAAQNLPGVAQNGGSAQIIVQGASPDDTGYVINNHRVPLVFHFGGLSSVVTPEAVARVDLLPSGYGPEYSKAIGGIIGLTTKSPKQDRLHGIAFVDLLNAGALVEGPIDDESSFLVSARYSYIGEVLQEIAKNNDDFELTAAPTYYDVNAIYEKKLSEKSKFSSTFILSRDELELILNRPAGNDPSLRGGFYNRTEFFRFIPQIDTVFNEKTRMSHSLGIGKDSLLVDLNGRYLDVNSSVITHRSELIHEWSPTSKTYIGLDNEFDSAKVRVNLPNNYSVGGVNNPFSVGEERKFDTKSDDFLLGAYLRQELKPSPESKWTFLPNLRIDHFSNTEETWLQPRIQTRYQWDSSLLLRSSFGLYVQPPQPQESAELYGNKDITSPYSWHYNVGFSKDFRNGQTNGLELTNNYFFKELKDLVIPDVQSNYSNSGTGQILGGEIQAKYRHNEWSSQLVYTYLKSDRRIPGFGTAPSEFDQTHNLNLIGAYNKEKWTFSGRFRFVSGNPFTPVNGATYDADNDVFIPIRGPIYSRRFDAFQQFDIRIDRKFIYDTWILTAYVDIQNLLNSQNAQNIEYSFDYSQNKKVRGLPILPTFGVKGEF